MSRPRRFNVDDVLTNAMNQFWRHGFGGTSMQQLLRRGCPA